MNRVYIDPQGKRHKYVIFVPFDLNESSRPPMLVYLNGQAENGDDGITAAHGPMGAQIWEMKARFPFVTVFPQCSFRGSWLTKTDSTRALAIIDQVGHEYHTDPERIYLTGASSGGAGTWAIAAGAPSRFAAIVPLCGAVGMEWVVPTLAKSQLPIWSFCKSEDEVGSAERERAIYHALLEAGSSPHYTEVPGRGHDCWNYAYRNPALYEWLLQQKRTQNGANSKFGPFTNLLPGNTLEGWKKTSEASWSIDSERNLRVADLDVSAMLRTASTYDEYDLHLDFMLGADEGFKVWLKLKEDLPAGSLGLQVCTPTFGSGGLFKEPGTQWLCPTDCVAQRSLVRNSWNDLRIRVHNDRVAVELNGYSLLNQELQTPSQEPTSIALEAGAHAGMLRWRNLRLRKLTRQGSLR